MPVWSQIIGKGLTGALKVGLGFGIQAGKMGWKSAAAVGEGIMGTSKRVGEGFVDASKKVGGVLAEPFATPEARRQTGINAAETIRDVGNAFVRENAKGHMELTGRGIGIIGAITVADKLRDSYYDTKTENLGIVDRQPVRATPDYRPRQYEMHPPKRITADSGGATGDLVFALHNLRNQGLY